MVLRSTVKITYQITYPRLFICQYDFEKGPFDKITLDKVEK